MEREGVPARGTRRAIRRLGLMALSLGLVACFENPGEGSGEAMTMGEDRRLEGRVMEVDATPMFVDGDGEIRLGTQDHGRVLIRIPARERLCRAQGLGVFPSLVPGDSVRVMGRVTAPREVTVCVEETHLLERIDEPRP